MKALRTFIEFDKKDISGNKIYLVISIFFAGLAGYAYFAFLPVYLWAKYFSEGETIFILMWMGVGMAIFSWSFGRISDKTGRRKLFFVLGLFFQVVVLSLIPLYNHIIYFCVLNFLRGFLLGMRMPASDALFADIVEKKSKLRAIDINKGMYEVSGIQLSLLSATKSTSWAIGVLFSSSIIAFFGIDSLVFFLIITTVISFCFALPIRDVRREELIINENEFIEMKEGDVSPNNNMQLENKKRARAKVKSLLFISVFFRQFGLISYLQIIGILLEKAEIPEGLIGIVIALNPILQVLAMVVMGRIIDNPKISERIMLATGFGLSALTLGCYALGYVTGSIIYFIFGQVSLGFAWGCIYTGAVKYILNRAPLDRAFYMGIWITDLQIAKIISYISFTFLWFIFSPTLVLPYAALGPLVGLFLVLWL